MKTTALIAIASVCTAASVSQKGDILNTLRQYAASQVDAATKAGCGWQACVTSGADKSRICGEAARATPSQRPILYLACVSSQQNQNNAACTNCYSAADDKANI